MSSKKPWTPVQGTRPWGDSVQVAIPACHLPLYARFGLARGLDPPISASCGCVCCCVGCTFVVPAAFLSCCFSSSVPLPGESAAGPLSRANWTPHALVTFPTLLPHAATTHAEKVFSFYQSNQPCRGLEDIVSRYAELVPHVKMSGPTSFGPIIRQAMKVVK